MKILNKLTIKSLKLNKKRTLVTIIGILLSTALITVVAGMVTSGKATLQDYFIKNNGDYQVEFKDVPTEDLSYIAENRNIDNYFLTSDIGYARFNESTNEDKPYFHIVAIDNGAQSKLPIKLTEGRFPTNSSEIVISQNIYDYMQTEGNQLDLSEPENPLKIGDTLTLDISKRLLDGKELTQDDIYTQEEYLEPVYTKIYTIVGIMERLNYTLEPYSAPGFTALTYLDVNNLGDTANIFANFTKDGVRNYEEVLCNILGLNAEDQKANSYIGIMELSTGTTKEEVGSKYDISLNDNVLQFEGIGVNSSYMRMLYLVGIVVVVIIIISSVFVIRNSFAISITERTRQYGMLSSIGATKKQIRKNVLFEGAILGLIGIPSGILLGILVNWILSIILNNLIGKIIDDVTFIYSVPVTAIIFSIILAVITIYFSCKASARRAAKLSPIDAIRSNEDIKIKGKKVKSPKIIKKIFGVGGDIAYKNLKRNRKKYRTTVISLVVSIAIFISITSLVQYSFTVSNQALTDYKYNLQVSISGSNIDKNEAYNTYKKIAQDERVNSYTITKHLYINLSTNDLKLSKDGREYLTNLTSEYSEAIESGEDAEYVVVMLALGDDEYQRYISNLGLNYKEAKDKIIWIDDFERYLYNEDGSYRKYIGEIYDYNRGDEITFDVSGNGAEVVENVTAPIIAQTTQKPMGLETTSYTEGTMIVSDEFINRFDWIFGTLYVNSDDASGLEKDVNANYQNVYTVNIQKEADRQNSLILVIAIFLYGFIIVISLIGVTNIFNTITSNMNLRSKEFANLKSIGMTKKEFNRMIRLESIFYGLKSIIIGLPLGVLGSYLLYLAFREGILMEYTFPVMPTVVAVVVVFLLIGGIMKYSLNKINKQNIIETIRKDNI